MRTVFTSKHATVRKLDDEYEVSQLNPVYSKTKEGEASQEQVEKMLDKLPEKESLKARIAIFEAVVDDVIDEVIEEKEEGVATSGDVYAEVEPVVEKAIALHIVPAGVKRNIQQLIANKLKQHSALIDLHEKAAHFLAASMTELPEDECVVEEVLDEKPFKGGVETEDPEQVCVPEGDNEQEAKDHATPTVNTDDTMPKPVDEALKFLSASSVAHRKATALVSKRISGVMLSQTLKALRHHLPAKFKAKYGIN